MNLEIWQEVIGFIGVALILSAYFAVQVNLISSQQRRFSLCNFIGAALILVSLYGSDNYAAITLETAWLAISAVGIFRAFRLHNPQKVSV